MNVGHICQALRCNDQNILFTSDVDIQEISQNRSVVLSVGDIMRRLFEITYVVGRN